MELFLNEYGFQYYSLCRDVIRSGATIANAPVDFENFGKILPKKEIWLTKWKMFDWDSISVKGIFNREFAHIE